MTATAADKIRVYVEHIPPFVIVNETGISGAAIDIINQAASLSDIAVDYQAIVWSRAFHEAKHKANVMLTGLIRTKSREQNFHWLIELPTSVERQNVFLWHMKKHALDKPAKDIKDAVVAVVLGDHKVQYYKNYMDKLGFKPNIYTVGSREQVIHMLFHQRVDYILGGELARPEQVEALGYDINLIERGPKLLNTSKGLYIALSKHTDIALVNQVDQALAKMKLSGKTDEILSRWHSKY